MKTYMIIARVNGQDYLTRVQAETASGAEHAVLDRGICSKYGYGVEACMAYDDEAMKTDTFIYNALNALPIGCNGLYDLIYDINEKLREKEEAEKEIKAIESKIAELEKQMESLNRQRADFLEQQAELKAIIHH